MKGPTFAMMSQIPHIVDLEAPRVVKILEGSEWCAEQGNWP